MTVESDDEFQGVGAHDLNRRWDPQVDEGDSPRTVVYDRGRMDLVRRLTVRGLAGRAAPDIAGYVRRLDGIDGSHWQADAGPVDLGRVRAVPTDWWAWKATQSVRYVDPTFRPMRTEATRLGFRHRSLYHWLSPVTDPEEQAAHYITTVGAMRAGDGAMGDFEESGITVDRCLAFCEPVERWYKRPMSIYTGLYVAGGTIWRDPRMRESRYGLRPMHLAAYITLSSLLTRLRTLGVEQLPIHAWQWSSDGPVPGIVGRCDMNTVVNRAVYDVACAVDQPLPIPPQQENRDMADIVHNAEDFFGVPPEGMRWWVRERADGRLALYHLNPAEWTALGALRGTPMSNDMIGQLGVVENGAWPAQPQGAACRFPTDGMVRVAPLDVQVAGVATPRA